jgi:hypothetical protein
METDTFAPLLTREIPLPVVDAGVDDHREGPLPRSLAQAAGGARARRGIALLLGLFLLLVALEAALLRRVWEPEPLVIYQAGPRTVLVRR